MWELGAFGLGIGTFPRLLVVATMAHRISGTNSSFRVEWRTAGKVLISIFQEFSSSINKAFILAGGLDAGLSFYGV